MKSVCRWRLSLSSSCLQPLAVAVDALSYFLPIYSPQDDEGPTAQDAVDVTEDDHVRSATELFIRRISQQEQHLNVARFCSFIPSILFTFFTLFDKFIARLVYVVHSVILLCACVGFEGSDYVYFGEVTRSAAPMSEINECLGTAFQGPGNDG